MIQLTTQQKDLLIGQMYDNSSYFNPIQDINNNWFVSEIECEMSDLQWLKDLPFSEFEPKPTIKPF